MNLQSIKRWAKPVTFAFVPMGIFAWFYLDRTAALGIMSLYGAISVGRIGMQVVTANLARSERFKVSQLPKATLIVTVYNEAPESLRRALASFKIQDYPDLEIIVVDDGSDNIEEVIIICEALGLRLVQMPHGGKRRALYRGFSLADKESKVILTADSDTVWSYSAARRLVEAIMASPKTGAATGFVSTSNGNTNFLTKLIHLRYYMAFNIERASQSYFGCVTCISGPLGAYRRDVLDRIKDKFVTQTFFGKECTFGDDRHLTNLILGLGYQVKYSQAVCYTEAPTTLKQFITQQARWGKSHWREMWWQFLALPKQHVYLAYDWCLSLLLPFLLTLSIARYGFLAVSGEPEFAVRLATTVFALSLIRVAEPLRQTKDPAFLLFVFYSFFHLFVLLPLKFYSLATVNLTGWGTRGTIKETERLANV